MIIYFLAKLLKVILYNYFRIKISLIFKKNLIYTYQLINIVIYRP